jgi:hypothetical protein
MLFLCLHSFIAEKICLCFSDAHFMCLILVFIFYLDYFYFVLDVDLNLSIFSSIFVVLCSQ